MIDFPKIDKAGPLRALVAMGGNAPERSEPAWQAMIRAVKAVDDLPQTRVVAVSGLWRSLPWGRVRQPPFFNAVMVLETGLSARDLLRALLAVERQFGRRRGMRPWGPRVLDLDLVDLGGKVMRPAGMGRRGSARARRAWQGKGMILPHTGVQERAFVLLPLAEVIPGWRHPVTGATARAMVARLPFRVRAQCLPVQKGREARAWNALRRRKAVHNRLY